MMPPPTRDPYLPEETMPSTPSASTSAATLPQTRQSVHDPCTYPQAFGAELDAIRSSRSRRLEGAACPDDRLKASLTGLALSGGGIRSATFNLGLIQALCKKPSGGGAPL